MAVANSDGSIVLTTKVDETGVKKGASTIKSVVGGIAKGMAAATAAIAGMGAAFVAGAKSTAEYGDRVDKLSQKIGLSRESFQQWDYIMQINGSSIETLQMGMKTLSNQAQAGAEEFTKLGLSQEFVKSASPEELFESTITALQGMEEGTERTAIASTLLGRSATELAPLLNSGAESVEALKQQAIDYGMVMSDEAVAASAAFQDSLTTLGMTATGLKNKFMAEFLPSITSVTDGLALLFTGDMSGLDKINEGINQFVGKISEILPKILEIGGSIISNLGQAILDNFPTLLNVLLQLWENIQRFIIQAAPKLVQAASQLIMQLAQALPELVQEIVNAIPALIQTILEALPTAIPAIINALTQMFVIICSSLPQIILPIIEALPDIIVSIVDALIENLPLLIQGCIQLVIGIVAALPQIIMSLLEAVAGIALKIGEVLFNSLPGPVQDAFSAAFDGIKAIWDAVQPYFQAIWEGIQSVFSVVGDVLGGFFSVAWTAIQTVWNTVTGFFQAIWDTISGIFSVVASVFTGDFQGAWEGIKGIVGTWGNFFKGVWDGIVNIFSAVGSWFSDIFQKAWDGIKGIWSAVTGFFSGIWDGIKNVFSSIGNWFGNKFKESRENSEKAWDNAKKSFSGIWNNIKGAFSSVGNWFSEKFSQAKENTVNAWSNIKEKFSGIWDKIKGAFNFSDMLKIGKNIVEGLWNGIKNMTAWVTEKIRGFCSSALGAIKNFFGIASPSKVMRDSVGKMMMEGLAEGITKNQKTPLSALDNVSKKMLDTSVVPNIVQGKIVPKMSGISNVSSAKEYSNFDDTAFINNIANRIADKISGKSSEIVLELNGRELGRAVVEEGGREYRRIGTRLVTS